MKGSKQPVKAGTGLDAAGPWGYGKQSIVQCTIYKIKSHCYAIMHFLKNKFKKRNMSFDAWTHLSPESFDWPGQFSSDRGELSSISSHQSPG